MPDMMTNLTLVERTPFKSFIITIVHTPQIDTTYCKARQYS